MLIIEVSNGQHTHEELAEYLEGIARAVRAGDLAGTGWDVDEQSDEEDHDELYGRDDYGDYPPEGSGRSDEYFRERD